VNSSNKSVKVTRKYVSVELRSFRRSIQQQCNSCVVPFHHVSPISANKIYITFEYHCWRNEGTEGLKQTAPSPCSQSPPAETQLSFITAMNRNERINDNWTTQWKVQ